MFEVWINNSKVITKENTKPTQLKRMKVYAGNKLDPPIDGKIKNLFVYSKKGSMIRIRILITLLSQNLTI